MIVREYQCESLEQQRKGIKIFGPLRLFWRLKHYKTIDKHVKSFLQTFRSVEKKAVHTRIDLHLLHSSHCLSMSSSSIAPASMIVYSLSNDNYFQRRGTNDQFLCSLSLSTSKIRLTNSIDCDERWWIASSIVSYRIQMPFSPLFSQIWVESKQHLSQW